MAFFVLIGRMALKWLYTHTQSIQTHITIYFWLRIFAASNSIDSVYHSSYICYAAIRISVDVTLFFYWYYKVHINLMRVLLELFDRYFVKYKCAPNITTVTVHLLGISRSISLVLCSCAAIYFLHSTEQNVTVFCSFLYIYVCFCIVETAKWKFFLLPLDSCFCEIDR